MNAKNLENILKRLKTLEDIEAVKKIMRHYVNCLVHVQWDDLMDCFTENARVEIGISGLREGRQAISTLFKQDIGTRHIGKEMIFLSHPIISIHGDTAFGKWMLYHMFTEADHIEKNTWVQGRYDCEYERIGEEWKINNLKWKQRLGPTSEKLMEKYGVIDV
jgi:hypothetical protein